MRVALVLALIVSVQAFGDTFTVNCAPLIQQRSDPIVNPGHPSSHTHAIVGGNAFARDMPGMAALKATGTTCDKKTDFSNYWVPQMYHIRQDGRYEMVPWSGTAVYYQVRACNYQKGLQYCDKTKVPLAFPDGFRMLAGDPFQRTFNHSIFAHRAVSMMCMNDDRSKEYNGFPPEKCNTIRAQVYFPSCWDGKNLDSANHRDHVAYPAIGDYNGGVCPASHPVALLSIFFEFFFQTKQYNDRNFVFAQGDRTGYGYHGDFIMGWSNRTLLQTAHQTCISDNNCPIKTAGAKPGENRAGKQNLLFPAIYEEDLGHLGNPIDRLPGNPMVDGIETKPAPAPPTSTNFGRLIKAGNYKFKSSNGKYVQHGADGILKMGDKPVVFTVAAEPEGFSIKSTSNRQFVTADGGGSLPLDAARDAVRGWELFTFASFGDNAWTISSSANNKFLTVQNDGKIIPTSNSPVANAQWFLESA